MYKERILNKLKYTKQFEKLQKAIQEKEPGKKHKIIFFYKISHPKKSRNFSRENSKSFAVK
jgi:hypothetical protein